MEHRRSGIPRADLLEKFYEAHKASMTAEEWQKFLKERECRRREIQRKFVLSRRVIEEILRETA